jgi:hypothetical protein
MKLGVLNYLKDMNKTNSEFHSANDQITIIWYELNEY